MINKEDMIGDFNVSFVNSVCKKQDKYDFGIYRGITCFIKSHFGGILKYRTENDIINIEEQVVGSVDWAKKYILYRELLKKLTERSVEAHLGVY